MGRRAVNQATLDFLAEKSLRDREGAGHAKLRSFDSPRESTRQSALALHSERLQRKAESIGHVSAKGSFYRAADLDFRGVVSTIVP